MFQKTPKDTFRTVLRFLGETFETFFRAHSATHGAAISFYAVTAFVPVLVITIAIAGFVFGEEAARGRIVEELHGLLGISGARLIENAIETASDLSAGTLATVISVAGFIFISSGVFLELRQGLNEIWEVKPKGETLTRFLRARAASFGLVVGFGFLLVISLAADTAITAFNDYINARIPLGAVFLQIVNYVVSFGLITLAFAAMYRVLPAKKLTWWNVAAAAVFTSMLFQIGKIAISAYLGAREIESTYGAAGALIALLFWVYYSAQIFLLGASLARSITLKQKEDARTP